MSSFQQDFFDLGKFFLGDSLEIVFGSTKLDLHDDAQIIEEGRYDGTDEDGISSLSLRL